MTLYHGTTDADAKRILKQGLKPIKARKFHFALYSIFGGVRDMSELDCDDCVYLTQVKSAARSFATFRARYESLPKGLHNIESPEQRQHWTIRVLNKKRVRLVKPVVLTVEIPDTEAQRLTDDPAWYLGLQWQGTVPPSWIKQAEPVTEPEPDTEADDIKF